MGLDIRVPIGLMFTVLGLLLVAYGLASDPAVYARSLGYNVNLVWGACVLVFGLVALALGRRGMSTAKPAAATPEGRAIEERERALHLERDRRPGGHGDR